jgi:hypothetical protein
MTLPPIWRLFQCIRRYKDTRNVFPHLVNGGKYLMTITATVMLSLYRIDNTSSNLALFIAFSVINSIYVCKSCPCVPDAYTNHDHGL